MLVLLVVMGNQTGNKNFNLKWSIHLSQKLKHKAVCGVRHKKVQTGAGGRVRGTGFRST